MAADVPLKSKRVPISLAVLSTAFFTSTMSGSQTVSKEGMDLLFISNDECDNSPMIVERNVPCSPQQLSASRRAPARMVRVRGEADVRACWRRPELAAASRFVLGGGSNIVLTGDVKGVVLKVEVPGRRVVGETARHTIVEAGAGENWHDFVGWTLEQGLPGLENLALIPGTVGASPVQNIGAYGVELQDRFHSLDAIDLRSGEPFTLDAAHCGFGYRDSVFKHAPRSPAASAWPAAC
jgi:UDP-N-acetylmuramate dehydrogenase